MTKRYILLLLWLLCALTGIHAQEFFNLTASEVRIDSMLPRFTWSVVLGTEYAEDYDVSIDYPEFIDMTPTDVARYHAIRRDTLPAMPIVDSYVGIIRKKATLYVSFIPVVFRDGRFQKLVSFKLSYKPRSEQQATGNRVHGAGHKAPSAAVTEPTRYASHSVLATGQWAKIRVSETGLYQLTEATIRRAGFSHLEKVKIYGYGGALQPETLTSGYLTETDDLKEVPTCTVGGRKLFWGVGPVSWSSDVATERTRNPYTNYGYYFITENDDEPLTVDSAAFKALGYPSASDYHSLYEVDDFAWYHTGRNLYESTLFSVGTPRKFELPAYSENGKLTVVLSSDGPYQARVELNSDTTITVNVTNNTPLYAKAEVKTFTYSVGNLKADNTVTITQASGSNVRLDYIALCSNNPKPMPDLENGTVPQAEYVYNITCQDHHADSVADMIIIIPTTQKLLSQAERLKALHEQKDGLRVRIVPADELFNEFSSGTPDVNAYRRYLKMMYDRATTDADIPRYLLLFGDGAWDNRMLSSNWRNYSPDDFLLCYESENSTSETYSYVSDDYYCLMDDGEGANMLSSDKPDIAVGRLSARTPEEAKIMVDKIYSYHANEMAGAWQNILCFMADDGNGNDQVSHMSDTESIITQMKRLHPNYQIKKVYWDAYTRQTSATGNSYPDAARLIKQQMQSGALVMNYTGHGAAYQISHEKVLTRNDFATSTSLRLPLWITASCDIAPFDSHEENIGETAMLNANGGAIAFIGTTRTVFQTSNAKINRVVLRHLLDTTDGKRNAIGEALRLAKCELIATSQSAEQDLSENKLHFVLLGDPALPLALPLGNIVIDSINGQPIGKDVVKIPAGSHTTVAGHIENQASFNGVATIVVQDAEETIVCKRNYISSVDEPFVFKDRTTTLYQGSDYVRNGRFSCTFAVPKDISFSDGTGQMLAYAVNDEKTISAHGRNESFQMVGKEDETNDGIGPSIYCYLNSASFTNGGTVNATPFFYAELSDNDGINAAGNGIGHNMELIIDGNVNMTYQLNDYFQYNFGDYRTGSVGYSLPELETGSHKLLFRAWDVLNNSSVAELDFVVDPHQRPTLSSVVCTKNPAATSTSFIISHDRTGSQMDIVLEIFDFSGRKLWQRAESGLSTDQTYELNWDLTTSSGSQLQTGVYLYRILVSSNGSSQATNAQKLIILRK